MRYEEIDGLVTRLRSQLGALSNEHKNFTAKVMQEPSPIQRGTSTTWTRRSRTRQPTRGGMQLEINLKKGELAHLPKVLEDVDVKRAHSTLRAQQSPSPYTLSSLYPRPISPERIAVSPARAEVLDARNGWSH